MKRIALSVLLIAMGFLSPVSNATALTSIGGLATSDLVLTKSQSPYVLTSTLQIPPGISVTVEAGVEIQSNGLDNMFWNQGSLTFKGTRENPIRLTGKPSLYVSIKNATLGSKLHISGVLFNGGGTVWSAGGYGGYTDLIFEDNEVKDLSGYFYVWYVTNKAQIQRNVFINSGGLSVGFSEGRDVSILNNLFIGPSKTGYWVESWAAYGGQLEVHNNNFQGGPYIAVQLRPDYKDVKINASSNYWGAQSPVAISNMVNDRNDGLSYLNVIDISNPLSEPAVGTPSTSILQVEAAAADKAAADKAAAMKKTSIVCVKGKLTKTVIAVKPVCPAGYKKK